MFLWLGADPKILAKVGLDYPLVTRAARSGDVGILRLLLEFGGDASEGSEKGQTQPINMAALKDKNKVIEVLVKFGANPNARYTMDFDGTVLAEGSGRTAMALAVTRGKTAASITLYRLGASLYNINEFGSDIHNMGIRI